MLYMEFLSGIGQPLGSLEFRLYRQRLQIVTVFSGQGKQLILYNGWARGGLFSLSGEQICDSCIVDFAVCRPLCIVLNFSVIFKKSIKIKPWGK